MGLSKETLEELMGYEQDTQSTDEWRRETVYRIAELLVDSGFESDTNVSNKGTESTFYYKEDIELVFCVINTELSKGVRRKGVYYTLIDKETWDELKELHPKFNIKDGGNYITIYLDRIEGEDEKYNGAPLHRFLKRKEKGGEWLEEEWEVDHVTHNGFINIKDTGFLRVCTGEQNRSNQKRRKNVEDEEYRYNPLMDFSQTWYVLIYEKMLRKITGEEREEYQEDYIKRTQADICN